MQTIEVKVTWARLNALLVACTTLIKEGHIVAAQNLTELLEPAKDEFTTELFKTLDKIGETEGVGEKEILCLHLREELGAVREELEADQEEVEADQEELEADQEEYDLEQDGDDSDGEQADCVDSDKTEDGGG